MEKGFYRNLGLTALICSVLTISACATVKPEEAVSENATAITQDVSKNTAAEAEGRFTKAADLSDAGKSTEQVNATAQASSDNAASQQNIIAKISQNQKRVKIKSAASNRARTIARLQGGKKVEILEEKGSWLKIRWQEKDKVREGWSRKEYVELIAN